MKGKRPWSLAPAMTIARMIGDGLEKGFVSWWLGVSKNLEHHAGSTHYLARSHAPEIVKEFARASAANVPAHRQRGKPGQGA